MTIVHLPDHIRFCEIGGQRIFLDLRRDRYFQLPPTADRAFGDLVLGSAADAEMVGALAAAGLLVAPPEGRPATATVHPPPKRSLPEEEPSVRVSWRGLPEVLLLVLWARRAVSRQRLSRLIGRPARPAAPDAASQDRLDRCVHAFQAARRLVPIAPNCLYDSLALRQFLLRRSVQADLIVGVKLHPFGAHCWLQDGPRVLNDTLASARDFAPILVA